MISFEVSQFGGVPSWQQRCPLPIKKQEFSNRTSGKARGSLWNWERDLVSSWVGIRDIFIAVLPRKNLRIQWELRCPYCTSVGSCLRQTSHYQRLSSITWLFGSRYNGDNTKNGVCSPLSDKYWKDAASVNS